MLLQLVQTIVIQTGLFPVLYVFCFFMSKLQSWAAGSSFAPWWSLFPALWSPVAQCRSDFNQSVSGLLLMLFHHLLWPKFAKNANINRQNLYNSLFLRQTELRWITLFSFKRWSDKKHKLNLNHRAEIILLSRENILPSYCHWSAWKPASREVSFQKVLEMF